jgi:hypothetical protein
MLDERDEERDSTRRKGEKGAMRGERRAARCERPEIKDEREAREAGSENFYAEREVRSERGERI